jgi:hypothetical protein
MMEEYAMFNARKPPQNNDPHSEDEDRYHDQARPGGARPPRDDMHKVNSETHDGKAPPKGRD